MFLFTKLGRAAQPNNLLKRFHSIDLFEYQAKNLLKSASVATQRFHLVTNLTEAIQALKSFRTDLGNSIFSVKYWAIWIYFYLSFYSLSI